MEKAINRMFLLTFLGIISWSAVLYLSDDVAAIVPALGSIVPGLCYLLTRAWR